MPDTDPQVPDLPYTWTDRDGDTVYVYQHTSRIQIVEASLRRSRATVSVPSGEDAVAMARAVLAAAGSTARVVEVPRCSCLCPESTHTGPGGHCIEPGCRDEPCDPIADTPSPDPDWRVVLLEAMGLDAADDIDPDDQDTWQRAYAVWSMHEGGREDAGRLCGGCYRRLAQPPGEVVAHSGSEQPNEQPSEQPALDLDAIRARAAAATPGPWSVETQGEQVTVLRPGTGATVAYCGSTDDPLAQADAALIAAAPALLAEVERLTLEESSRLARQVDEARTEHDDYQDRLRATDQSWSRLAAERDQAREESARAYTRGVEDARGLAKRLARQYGGSAQDLVAMLEMTDLEKFVGPGGERDQARTDPAATRADDETTLAGRVTALEAALRRAAAEHSRLAVRVEDVELAQSDHDHRADRHTAECALQDATWAGWIRVGGAVWCPQCAEKSTDPRVIAELARIAEEQAIRDAQASQDPLIPREVL